MCSKKAGERVVSCVMPVTTPTAVRCRNAGDDKTGRLPANRSPLPRLQSHPAAARASVQCSYLSRQASRTRGGDLHTGPCQLYIYTVLHTQIPTTAEATHVRYKLCN